MKTSLIASVACALIGVGTWFSLIIFFGVLPILFDIHLIDLGYGIAIFFAGVIWFAFIPTIQIFDQEGEKRTLESVSKGEAITEKLGIALGRSGIVMETEFTPNAIGVWQVVLSELKKQFVFLDYSFLPNFMGFINNNKFFALIDAEYRLNSSRGLVVFFDPINSKVTHYGEYTTDGRTFMYSDELIKLIEMLFGKDNGKSQMNLPSGTKAQIITDLG